MKELIKEQKEYIIKGMIATLDGHVCSADGVTLKNYKNYSKKDYQGAYINFDDEYDLIISIIEALKEDD